MSILTGCGSTMWKSIRSASRWKPATGLASPCIQSPSVRPSVRWTCWSSTVRERILVNSSADWGPSDPFTLQECILEFRRRKHSLQEAIEIFHNNPCRFLGQTPKFDIKPIRIEEQDAAAIE